MPGAELDVWAGKDGKVYLIDVPAQRSAYVREGYESLRGEEQPDPTLSPPSFEVLEERSVELPMRDGLALSTDLWRPKGVDMRWYRAWLKGGKRDLDSLPRGRSPLLSEADRERIQKA
jgi:predicted acyl esterase